MELDRTLIVDIIYFMYKKVWIYQNAVDNKARVRKLDLYFETDEELKQKISALSDNDLELLLLLIGQIQPRL
jgi:hypothetical protein